MPQSYSPVYLPQDYSATSMGANNISVDVPVDDTSRELTIPACLDPSTLTNTSAVISNNNLTFRSHNASAWHGIRANIGISGTDKVYWEVVCSEDDHNTFVAGVGSTAAVLSNSPNTAGSLSYIQPSTNSGEKYDGTAISVTMGNTVGDVWGFAVDYANQDLYLSKNGIWWNGSNFTSSPTAPGTIWDATLSNSVTLFPIIQGHNQGETTTMRFSSGDWYYSAPSTYTALTKTVTGVGNHWTLNPLASTDTLTNGNLSFTAAANFTTYVTAPAIPMSGKWYYEITAIGGDAAIGTSASYDAYLGLVSTDVAIPTGSHTSNANLWVIANWNPTPSGQKANGSTATYTPTSGFGDGSIIMVAVDMDNSKIYFGNDGTWAGSGNPASGSNPAFSNLSGQLMPYHAAHSDKATYNFGAKPFIHTPPTGFKALNTANLPAPTVTSPTDHFGTLLWTGDDEGSRLIATGQDGVTGTLNFTPDFVWIKRRDSAQSNFIFDSVRTVRRYLHTNSADAEPGSNGGLVSFASNGFNIDNTDSFNTASQTRVAWCLEANTSWSESAQNSNILASSGKKSGTAKFSIATWEHRTSANYAIKHNLGTTPEFFMIKSVDQATNWSNWHTGLSDSANRVVMTDAGTEASSYWADASDSADGSGSYADISSGESPVTSTLFAIQDGEAGAGTFVGYFFARTPGLIGIGSYIGNTTNLPCVVVDDGASGFRPAWIMFKNISASGYGWSIFDVAREASDGNPNSTALNASGSGGDSSVASYQHDILANGFKIRGTSGETNGNGNTIIYLAFAEHPFGGSGVAQARARS